MKIRSLYKKISLLTIISTLALSVNAATVSFMDTINLQMTNWTETLTVDKFDSSLGTLTSISFTLEGTVEGAANYESLDAGPANVTLDLSAIIEVNRPGGGTLIVDVQPLANVTDSADPFDGAIDFGGTSGNSFPGLTDTDTDAAVSSAAADLALFTGNAGDTITLDATASGMSTGSGAGNLVTQFMTSASANLTVEYTFDEAPPVNPVPEPGTMFLMGAGILGLIGIRKRRK